MTPQAELRHGTGGLPESAVRDELARILASRVFAKSERLTRFLRFIVEQTLEGHAAGLKEQVLASELYGRGADFNSAADPIVRVDARRLRDKLREYYSESPDDSVVIELPKGTYVPVFEYRAALPLPLGDAVSAAPRPSRSWWIAALIAAALLSVLALTLSSGISGRRDSAVFERLKSRRLTQSGNVRIAVLSPDARRVAIVSGDPGSRSLHIRDVDGRGVLEVLPPGSDHIVGVTFSPDGADLFVVARKPEESTGTLYTIPAGGGVKHAIKRFVDSPVSFSPDGSRFAFVREHPDRRLSTLTVANRDGSGEREMLSRKLPEYLDYPAWSPDGKTIACTLVNGRVRFTSVVLVDLADSTQMRPLVGGMWPYLFSLSWTRDGKHLVTAGRSLGGGHTQPLWLLDVPGGRARVITGALDSYYRVHSAGNRLVAIQYWVSTRVLITRARANGEIPPDTQWTAVLQRGAAGHSGTPGPPKVSWTADGKIITAEGQLFRSRVDGTLEMQLTRNGDNNNASACGDGRHIVYTSELDGILQLWRIDLDGRNPVRLTTDTVFGGAHCSPDGRWVAYSGPGPHGWTALWRVPIEGGQPVQLNENVARRPAISPDGKHIAALFGSPAEGEQGELSNLAVFPATGGPPARVFSLPATTDRRVEPRWTPDGSGIAYVDERGATSDIWVQPLNGSAARRLSNFTSDRVVGFDWSKDGRQLAVSLAGMPHDAVLIENGR
jgi:eukaryotic-like serine/threonine-protein kinase